MPGSFCNAAFVCWKLVGITVFSLLSSNKLLCVSQTRTSCVRGGVFLCFLISSRRRPMTMRYSFFVLWRAQLKKKIFNLLLVSRISSPTKRIYLCKEEEVDEPNSTKSKSRLSGWESCVLWAHLEVLIAVEKWTVLCCDEVTQSLSLSLPLLHNAQQRYRVVSVVRMSLFSDFLHKNSITLAEWAFNKHKIYAVKYNFFIVFWYLSAYHFTFPAPCSLLLAACRLADFLHVCGGKLRASSLAHISLNNTTIFSPSDFTFGFNASQPWMFS